MICDICGKNQASVHLTEIIDESMNELHLCEGCARQKSAQMEQQFGLGDLLAGLADFEKPSAEKEASGLKCSNCGFSYVDFKKIGRLGCSQCYHSFRKYLGSLLKKIHGSLLHFGKCPVNPLKVSKESSQLAQLRCALQKAIESEAFEEAAKLRDQVRELEQKKVEE